MLQHCCLRCYNLLESDTPRFTLYEQWFCSACAKEVSTSTSKKVYSVPNKAADAILRSLEASFWTCGVCDNFTGMTRESMHAHTNRDNHKFQILFSGKYMQYGFGTISPTISKSACTKMPCVCKFCKTPLKNLEDWPYHIVTECKKIPCIFSHACVQEGVLDYVDRECFDIHFDNSNVLNLSHFFNNVKHYCTWGTHDKDNYTWKDMIHHLNSSNEGTFHKDIQSAISLLGKISSTLQMKIKKKETRKPKILMLLQSRQDTDVHL